MKIKPITLLGTTQRRSLSKDLTPIVEAWAADWFSAVPTPVLKVRAPLDRTREFEQIDAWRFFDSGRAHEAVCAIDQADRQRLLSLLLCTPDTPCPLSGQMRISAALIQDAVSDLIARLLSTPKDGLAVIREDTLARCASPAKAECGHDGFYLAADLDGMMIHCWLPVQPFLPHVSSCLPLPGVGNERLTHPKDVLSRQVLDFEVRLGSAELPLGHISRLKIGDVIRLDKEFKDPLYLVFRQSPAKFACYLGRQGGRYAIRIESLIGGE